MMVCSRTIYVHFHMDSRQDADNFCNQTGLNIPTNVFNISSTISIKVTAESVRADSVPVMVAASHHRGWV